MFYAVTYHFAPFEIAFRRKHEVFSAKYDAEFIFVESVYVPSFFDDGGKGFGSFCHFFVGNAIFSDVSQWTFVAIDSFRALRIEIFLKRFENRIVG